MLHVVVPDAEHGGVLDYGTRIHEYVGPTESRLVRLSRGTAADWQVGPQDDVYVQFSGYGYAKRGAPLWLLDCLLSRKRLARSVGVYFHELYAMGRPWTSSFWLSPVQRYIAASLARLSDYWMTNREASATWLQRFTPRKKGAVLPVFSNIGESSSYSPQRKPFVVIFGSPQLRLKTYEAAGSRLFEFTAAASLQIHDIGTPITDTRVSQRLHEAGAIMHGRLPEKEVLALLQSATIGIVEYPVAFVGKSGVFAAFAANGVCPLLISSDPGGAEGLVPGLHFESWARASALGDRAAEIGRSAWDWYQGHRIEIHVQHCLARVGAGCAMPVAEV